MKPILGFTGYYVDRQGKIYSDLGQGNHNRDIRVSKYEVKPRPSRNGYQRVYMRRDVDNKRVDQYIHRLVAEAYLRNKLGLPIVNHKDANRANNSVSNLEWVSVAGNNAYTFDIGNIERNSAGQFSVPITPKG